MAVKSALPDKKVIAYFTRVMLDRRASAYRRDQAAKTLARLCQAEAKRLKAKDAKPAQAASAPKLGKKAEREAAASTAHQGSGWEGLIK